MPDTRTIIRVFLASPGDLGDERRTAKLVVEELNSMFADQLGYQIELVGWEDTVSVFGRPQEIINRELERCELFIGMLWRRWGTPPDNTGRYSSGFEEEFRTSVARRTRDNAPEISVFFKDIPEDFLRDPGEDLKRVLAFRRELIEDKKLLFQPFANLHDFESKLRRCISRYILNLHKQRTSVNEGPANIRGTSAVDDESPDTALSSRGVKFALDFLHRLSATPRASLSALEVAQFRLLGTLVGEQGNDAPSLGVHDSNLLFLNREKVHLGDQEVLGLVAVGLDHLSAETTPLWYWLATAGHQRPLLPVYSVVSSAARRVGAITAMHLAAQSIPTLPELSRDDFVSSWLAVGAPSEVKAAALSYLADLGTQADAAAVRSEYERGNSQTVDLASTTLLRITLRNSRAEAINVLYGMQSSSLSADLVEELFGDGAGISEDLLLKGLHHRNATVRGKALRLLRAKTELSPAVLERLLDDSSAAVRFEALSALRSLGREITGDTAKSVLVKPRQSSVGLFGVSADSEGEECLARFGREALDSLSVSQLKDKLQNSYFEFDSLHALARKRFLDYADVLRRNVDDRYGDAFDQEQRRVTAFLGDEAGAGWTSVRDFVRNRLTRESLNVICSRFDPTDLERVRTAVSDGILDYSEPVLEYIKHCGRWEDIPLVVQLVQRAPGAESILGPPNDRAFVSGARVVLELAGMRTAEVLQSQMPWRLLFYLTREMRLKVFRRLPSPVITSLLNNQIDSVRKVGALKCVQALSKTKRHQLLQAHLSQESYFYNVVHWLDFGVSLPAEESASAAGRILQHLRP